MFACKALYVNFNLCMNVWTDGRLNIYTDRRIDYCKYFDCFQIKCTSLSEFLIKVGGWLLTAIIIIAFVVFSGDFKEHTKKEQNTQKRWILQSGHSGTELENAIWGTFKFPIKLWNDNKLLYYQLSETHLLGLNTTSYFQNMTTIIKKNILLLPL